MKRLSAATRGRSGSRANRLHPLHDSLQPALAEVRGPSGLIRRNPHAVGFIGPNGIKRIDRLNGNGATAQGGRRSSAAAKEVVLPLHQVENPDYYIAVVPDMVGGRLSGHDRDVLGQAHKLIREIGGARCGAGGGVWRAP